MKDAEWAVIIDWMLSAEFDESNAYLGAVLSELFVHSHYTELDELGRRSTSAPSPWTRSVALQCIEHDFSCPYLQSLSQECAASGIIEISEVGRSVQARMASVYGRTKTKLDTYLRQCNADSYTFYVPNPAPAGSYCLYLSRGIRFLEAAHGVFMDDQFAQRVFDKNETSIHDHLEVLRQRFETTNPLYRDFKKREGFDQSKSLTLTSAGMSRFALFLNYRSITGSQRYPTLDDKLLTEVSELLPEILDDAKPSNEDVAALVGLQEQYAAISDTACNIFLSALKDCMRILNVSPSEALATVSLYDDIQREISVVASVGICDNDVRSYSCQIEAATGIVPWVAIKRRALLISNLTSSGFTMLRQTYLSNAQSILAVPVVSGGRLRGVISFESQIARAFRPSDLRLIWTFGSFLAQQMESRESVALQYRSVRTEISRCEKQSAAHASNRFEAIAQLAKKQLASDHADVWGCCLEGDFTTAGSTIPNWTINCRPRQNGWTTYVFRSRSPVWVNIHEQGCVAFSLHDSWKKIDDGPTDVNPTIRPAIKCELGLPVIGDGEVLAVIWLKFSSHRPLPLPEDLELALYFAEKSSKLLRAA
ncbi:MAG: GAF domain-containing protein [Pirellulaceae bacterium]